MACGVLGCCLGLYWVLLLATECCPHPATAALGRTCTNFTYLWAFWVPFEWALLNRRGGLSSSRPHPGPHLSLQSIPHPSSLFPPHLVAGSVENGRKLHVIPRAKKGAEGQPPGHSSHILCMAISSDGKYLVRPGQPWGLDGCLWMLFSPPHSSPPPFRPQATAAS